MKRIRREHNAIGRDYRRRFGGFPGLFADFKDVRHVKIVAHHKMVSEGRAAVYAFELI
jgi:hypothetical protein